MQNQSRKITLTNTAVKAASPGETLWDVDVPGLHLRASERRKSYYLFYRTKTGVQRRPKIGSTDIVALADARTIARKWLTVVAGGGDPMRDRELAIESPTVDELFERVMCDHWQKKKSKREIRKRYERCMQRRLGRLRVREVTFNDVAAAHAVLADTPTQANRALTDLAKMFNFAERPLQWRDRHTNPCSGVIPYPEKKRKVFYKGEHLQRLVPILRRDLALPGDDRSAVARRRAAAYLIVQLYSGARPKEPAMIVPEIVDAHADGSGVARLPDAKTGQRDLYLPPQAMAALRVLPWRAGHSILGRFPRKLWLKIRPEAGCEGLWARDTRRTFGTAVLSTPHGAQAGNLLGHASAQTTKRYVELIEDSARDAAAAGAARIDELAAA